MYKILVLPGDGVGKEVAAEAVGVLKALGAKHKLDFSFEEALIGGSSLDEYGVPIKDEVIQIAKKSDAVLLGAVGGPKWDGVDYALRPERALLALRAELKAFANLRPVKVLPVLADSSPLKRELIEGVDIMLVRELVGGLYFGRPKGIKKLAGGKEKGYNTLVYTTPEVERVARVGFEIARSRKKKLTSVDKANVLESNVLWRKVVTRVAEEYPDVELKHMYVDNCAMQLIRTPKQFDVIVTTNMFGDILADEASMLSGSIGMLPSASIGGKVGIYEPIHGSAPGRAGQNKGNPIATILSAAMMLRFAFNKEEASEEIERAIVKVLDEDYRTLDIHQEGKKLVGTREMGELIRERLL